LGLTLVLVEQGCCAARRSQEVAADATRRKQQAAVGTDEFSSDPVVNEGVKHGREHSRDTRPGAAGHGGNGWPTKASAWDVGGKGDNAGRWWWFVRRNLYAAVLRRCRRIYR
jgi:hypothetical protein